MVFNGEIYNYCKLRSELDKVYEFRTTSDTETLLAAYLFWGMDLFDRIEGMFAFGIWDPRTRSVLLGRDHCGQKPLYYSSVSRVIAFASELQALRLLCPEKTHLDRAALEDYLRYWCVPAPHTLIQGLNKVPAGHYVRLDESGERLERYWYPVRGSAKWRQIARTPGEWEEVLCSQLQESVASACTSDVPIAMAFSGGSDSVSVAVAALGSTQALETFSIDVNGSSDPDEEQIRRRFQAWAGIRHHSAKVSEPALREWVSADLRVFDEPVADNTVIFSAALASSVRSHGYKVFLTGEGGDEVFVGYPWWIKLFRWQRRIQSLGGLGKLCAPFIPASHRDRAVFRMFDRANSGPNNVYWDSQLGLPCNTRRALLSFPQDCPGRSFVDGVREDFIAQGGMSESQWFTYIDLNLRLPELLLLRLDRAAMLHSTEPRSPLLDKRLIELALAIPDDVKLKHLKPKAIYLRALRRLVPEELIIRRKIGYNQGIRTELSGLCGVMRSSVTEWNERMGLFRSDRLRSFTETCGAEVLWPLYALSEWANGSRDAGGVQ
jgi:asparagine synthase (glutamine-hydrolysing)